MKDEYSFEKWFEQLRLIVLEKTNVEFTDEDSVREYYESGKSFEDVAD